MKERASREKDKMFFIKVRLEKLTAKIRLQLRNNRVVYFCDELIVLLLLV